MRQEMLKKPSVNSGGAGAGTRREILKAAVDTASAEGLEGVTIGRLAKDLGMSKSGLFGHFGSKVDLQLATIEMAREIFFERIIEPANKVDTGFERLEAMIELWISYVESNLFRGGCFFAAASMEFDGRPGPVREEIATLTRAWVDALENETQRAQERGEFDRTVDPGQFVFEIHSFVQEANWGFQLLDDEQYFSRARTSIQNRLVSSRVR